MPTALIITDNYMTITKMFVTHQPPLSSLAPYHMLLEEFVVCLKVICVAIYKIFGLHTVLQLKFSNVPNQQSIHKQLKLNDNNS
jgi:hypothetical protein